jgi:hypothetical protein
METMPNDECALVLARLIYAGLATAQPENLPQPWRTAYDAVRLVPASILSQRIRAFDEAIAEDPLANHLQADLEDARYKLDNTAIDQLRVYSGWETLQPPPLQKSTVGGVFTRPSLNLLVGAPGVKKTWLALDLAVSVATGQPWLGHPTEAAPVLILDEEGGLQRTWERLGRVMRGHSAPAETPVYFIPPSSFNFSRQESADSLAARANSLGVGLIIIDALVNIMPGCDENNVLSVQPVLDNLRYLARQTGATVVVIHHTNKQGIFRGSTSLSSGVDHLLLVESSPQEDLVELTTVKARDVEPVALTALCHFTADSFHATRTDHLPPIKLSTPALALLKDLAQRGSAPISALSSADRTASRTRTLLSELTAAGFVVRNPGSRGTRALYSLSPHAVKLLATPTPEKQATT